MLEALAALEATTLVTTCVTVDIAAVCGDGSLPKLDVTAFSPQTCSHKRTAVERYICAIRRRVCIRCRVKSAHGLPRLPSVVLGLTRAHGWLREG